VGERRSPSVLDVLVYTTAVRCRWMQGTINHALCKIVI